MAPGVSKLANKDLYDFHILITPDNISEIFQNKAIALCEDRQDAVAIIDPPIGLIVENVINCHNGSGFGRSTALTSNYALHIVLGEKFMKIQMAKQNILG